MLVSLIKIKKGEKINKETLKKIYFVGYASLVCVLIKMGRSKKFRNWIKSAAVGTFNASILTVSFSFLAFLIYQHNERKK